MSLTKPKVLCPGNTVAIVSPSWGLAGEERTAWKYALGVSRLEQMGLRVVAAPSALRGEAYLRENPQARAEDILWAFEEKSVRAMFAAIGGNDSDRILPYLCAETIRQNPKIVCGYSDVMNLHLFCYRAGLATFYGPNLLTTIAETPQMHPYSSRWLECALFSPTPLGTLTPAADISCDENDHEDPTHAKTYRAAGGYRWLQGSGIVRGRLFGGHTGLADDSKLCAEDFAGAILFLEDIPAFFTPENLADFFARLARMGALSGLCGLLLGRHAANEPIDAQLAAIVHVLADHGRADLPVVAEMNFGHTSPICILPYGAQAEIDCEAQTVTIIEAATHA